MGMYANPTPRLNCRPTGGDEMTPRNYPRFCPSASLPRLNRGRGRQVTPPSLVPLRRTSAELSADGDAPALTSASATRACPFSAAQCSAVFRSSFTAFTSWGEGRGGEVRGPDLQRNWPVAA